MSGDRPPGQPSGPEPQGSGPYSAGPQYSGPPPQQNPQYSGPQYYGPQYGGPQQPPAGQPPQGPYPLSGQPPQSPYGPSGPGQPPGAKKGNARTLIIVGAVVLALIVGGIVAGVAFSRKSETPTTGPNPQTSGGAPSGPASSAPAAGTPSDAVKAYLQAIVAGQADVALSLGAKQPADKTFLTDEVLRAAMKAAPITDIKVPEVNDKYAYKVDATYKIGGQPNGDGIRVQKVGETWKVTNAFKEVDLRYVRERTLPMIINGVTVKTNKIWLFPGGYSFTTGTKNIVYGDTGKVVVESPDSYDSFTSDLRPELSSAGEDAFIAAVKSNVKKCLSSDQLKNPGCPNNVTRVRGTCKPKDGTIKWKNTSEGLDNLKPTLDSSNPVYAQAYASMSLEGTGDYQGGTCRVTIFSIPRPQINMLNEPLKVVWTR